MCRNITELRGLEPPATADEVHAAAQQYVRKVSGVRDPRPAQAEAYEAAVTAVATATAELLAALPRRRVPPRTVPPLRRPEVRARLGLEPLAVPDAVADAVPDAGDVAVPTRPPRAPTTQQYRSIRQS